MATSFRTVLSIAAGGALLAACAAGPYDYGYGYGSPYYDAAPGYYYGPGYDYYGPSVGVGVEYGSRDGWGRDRRDAREWRERHADRDGDGSWARQQPSREQWERYNNPQERINRERSQNGGGG
jgi:hypothetical protein